MIYADLHLHTHYSDGTQTLDQVFALAKEKGIQVAAITDHDTLFHYDAVCKTAQQYGIRTIRGVEMSCYDYDVSKRVHIVGLWLNEEAPHCEALCSRVLQGRDAYHRILIRKLQEKGFDITYEDAKVFSPHNIVFKMNIFQALVRKYPQMADLSKYRAMFGGQGGSSDKQMSYIDVRQGIEAILADRGVPILAHPCEYDNYDEVEKYASYGLRGIEISHPLMKEADYDRTLELQKRLNLLASGGSDYHDPRMPTLGKCGLTEEQFRLLESSI